MRSNGGNGNGNGRDTLTTRPAIRCAIYTRKSTDENLDSDFNSLDAQREACENYIKSQTAEGWVALPEHYDDGACSGANMERPAVQRLLADAEAGRVDAIVIYKIDRLSRSLLDFAKLIGFLEDKSISLVSVTQQFNTTTSMGRLTLNILLSFAQFEREVIAERIRDKVRASRQKGKYMGGRPVLGYDGDGQAKKWIVNETEATTVRTIFTRYSQGLTPKQIADELNRNGHTTKSWINRKGLTVRPRPWNKFHIYRMIINPLYIGRVVHRGEVYPGEHQGIIDMPLWTSVQGLLAENAHARANHPRAVVPGILRGILRCGHCDCSMGPTYTKKGARQYRYYLCVRAAKQGYSACPTKSLSAGMIETAVMERVRDLLLTPEVIAMTYRAAGTARDERIAEIDRQVTASPSSAHTKTLRPTPRPPGRPRRVGGLPTVQPLDAEAISRLTAEREGLSAPFSEQDISAALTDFTALWNELFPEEQARIISLLIDRAIVYPDRLDLVIRKDGVMNVIRDMQGGKGAGLGVDR